MRKILPLLPLTLAMLIVAGVVYASIGSIAPHMAQMIVAALGPTHTTVQKPLLLNAVGLDASRTFEVEIGPDTLFGLATLYISLTDADNSTTAFDLSCTGSRDNNSTDYTLQSCTTASGVCTSSNASWTKNPSAITSPKRWIWRVDIEGVEDFECTVTDTGGVAADTVTIDGVLSTKGS